MKSNSINCHNILIRNKQIISLIIFQNVQMLNRKTLNKYFVDIGGILYIWIILAS
jgi:hypothetical protein